MKLKNHLASFLQGEKAKTRPKRTKSQVNAFFVVKLSKRLIFGCRERLTLKARATNAPTPIDGAGQLLLAEHCLRRFNNI